MTQINRYAKRILKQYGKNIKVFDERLSNPLEDKRITKFSENYKNVKGVPISALYTRKIETSIYLKRGGKRCGGYQDLEALANGPN